MPFHIDYSGPAPISTFFRAKRVEAAETAASTSKNTSAQEKTRYTAAFRGRVVHGLEVALPEGYGGIVLRADGVQGGAGMSPPAAKEARKTRAATRRKPARRATRAAARAGDVDADDGDAGGAPMDLDADEAALLVPQDAGDVAGVRTLQPSATFASLVVWNADIPVDEGKDEYLRTLGEWTSLAAEVCFTSAAVFRDFSC